MLLARFDDDGDDNDDDGWTSLLILNVQHLLTYKAIIRKYLWYLLGE